MWSFRAANNCCFLLSMRGEVDHFSDTQTTLETMRPVKVSVR